MKMKKFLGIALLCLSLISGCGGSPQESSPLTQSSVQARDPNCMYIPESSIPTGMSANDYKANVKRETGAKCVFFTGG